MIYVFAILIAVYLMAKLLIRKKLFQKQLDIPGSQGLIPVKSHIRMYKQINEKSRPLYGIILRWSGLLLIAFIFAWQTYYNQLLMTHMYGLLLHFYEAPDYSVIWNILNSTGAILLACGIAIRFILTKRMNMYFGISSKGLDILGALCPTLYEFYLAHTKKYSFVLHKTPEQMSREEFQLYCTLKDM